MDPSSSCPPWIVPFFLAHAGCPHRCVFCDQSLIAGTPRAPSPEKVRESLEALCPSRRFDGKARRQVAFYGGSFTRMPPERQHAYLEACRPALRKGWMDSIRISTRPDEVSQGQLAFLAERGVETVELGVQSLSDRVLRASRRGHTGKQARDAVKRACAIGLQVGAQIMVGLPEDTGEESLRTAEELAELKPHFVRIYPLLVLRHTEIARWMRRGSYRALGLEEAVSLCTGMLRRFEEADVPVIRIGLQEQEDLGCDGGGVLAGPYHPSFGHLVRSSLFIEKVLAALPRGLPASSAVCLRVHPHDRALLAGHRRQNFEKLRNALQDRRIRVEEDPGLPRGRVQCRVDGERGKAEGRGQGLGIRARARRPSDDDMLTEARAGSS